MTATQTAGAIHSLFEGRDEIVGKIYSRLLRAVRAEVAKGAVEDPKKTCIHLVAGPGGSAFAGVHPRKAALLLTIKSEAPIKSKRVRKMEQVSRSRCHNDLLLKSVDDVDAELLGWLGAGYQMSTKTPG